MWICQKCKEENEDNFDICWNCQSEKSKSGKVSEKSEDRTMKNEEKLDVKQPVEEKKLVILRREFVLAEYNRHLLCKRYVNDEEFYKIFQDEIKKVELPEKKMPFDIQLMQVKWWGPFEETRKRLKIAMNAHFYENINMLVGLDYMGAYANIQLHAVEIQEEEHPLKKPVMGEVGCRPQFMGPSRQEREYQEAMEAYHREIKRREDREKTLKILESIRGFKDDDLKLFCTIVQQTTKRVLDELFKDAEMKREHIGGLDVFGLLN